jgi:hypothetical protein
VFEDPGISIADPDLLICDPAAALMAGHATIVAKGNEDDTDVLLTTLIA